MAAEGLIDLKSLITHRLSIADAQTTYDAMIKGDLPGAIGIVLQYPKDAPLKRVVTLKEAVCPHREADVRVAVLGAGQFGRTTLLPVLAKAKGVSLQVLATSSGSSAEHSGRRYGFAECSTDGDAVFGRQDVDVVFALTPHSRHAQDVVMAAKSGKHLFVEKPLCVTLEELEEIEKVFQALPAVPLVMVGHNRRYSPHIGKIRTWLEGRHGPLVMSLRVNAGFVPREHWVHSKAHGRSRIVGEMTHFLDLIEAASSARITEVFALRVSADDHTIINNDNVSVNLRLDDGSVAALVYSAQGPRGYPREHIEIFSGGSAVVSTDFRHSMLYGPSKNEKFSTSSQTYGYAEEIAHFVAAAKGQEACEAGITTQIRIMKAAFAIERSLATGEPAAIS